MFVFYTGLLLGFSLIMAIGSQNVFVIRQGLSRNHPLLSAFMCSICDVLLIIFGVTSVGHALTQFPVIKTVLIASGLVFLLWYGTKSVISAYYSSDNPQIITNNQTQKNTICKVLLLSASFSLLNPHAIIDTVVIIGSVASHYHNIMLYEFIGGTIVASFIWFFGLTLCAMYMTQHLKNPKVWRALEMLSALIMYAIALKLVL